MYRATRRAAAHEWLEGAESGVIRNRSGDMYKPSVIRGYDEALRLRVLPAIGAHKLADIAARDVQDLIDRWQAEGLSASAIRRAPAGWYRMQPSSQTYRGVRRQIGLLAASPSGGGTSDAGPTIG
jgi:hypothetical protein